MTDESILMMGIVTAAWGLLMAWWAPRLRATTLLHSVIALSLAFFIVAAIGPAVGENQVSLVIAVFLIPGLVTFFSAMMARSRF
jgi:hypothetical protein